MAHVERYGDTDIFPLPFEYAAIRHEWGRYLPELLAIDVTKHQVGEYHRTLTPKSRYGFRVATQLHPTDFLLFSATVYELARDFETYRVPAKHDIVMSHRVRRDTKGQLFNPQFTFDRFKEALRQKCAESSGGWVATTDIADFYGRLYRHPLENALRTATNQQEHVDALMHLLSQWNYSASYGIPVGPAATRLIAEVAISDVDQALLDERINFSRFSDDFRLFAPTEREAFRALAVLADYLHENHGLTLSERKTDVVPVEQFVYRHLDGTRPGDSAALSDRIGQLLEKYGREHDIYAALEVEDLPPGLVDELDNLDLNQVLREQFNGHRMFDPFAASIALRRLGQLRDATLVDLVVDNLDYLTPVLPQVVTFIRRATPRERRSEIGAKVLAVVTAGLSAHREYQRCWLLSLFVDDRSWNGRDALIELLNDVGNDVSRPVLLQALGSASYDHWFRRSRRHAQSLNGWQRRSFIRGATCLTTDEYTHWLNSLMPRLNSFEQVVARYCMASQEMLRPSR